VRQEFSAKVKLAAFQRAKGRCEAEGCGALLMPGRFRYDHRIPDQMGGEPSLENCQVICLACDAPKTAADQGRIAKAKRLELRAAGIRKPRTIRAWRKFNGQPVYAGRER
jgi:5-methylcytosine-specific restriction endonuclease McrA